VCGFPKVLATCSYTTHKRQLRYLILQLTPPRPSPKHRDKSPVSRTPLRSPMAPSFLLLLRGAMAPLSLLLLSLSSADAYTLHVTGESTRLVLARRTCIPSLHTTAQTLTKAAAAAMAGGRCELARSTSHNLPFDLPPSPARSARISRAISRAGACGREAQLVRHGLVDPLQLCLRVRDAGRLTGRLTGRHAGRRRTPAATHRGPTRRLVRRRFRVRVRVSTCRCQRQRAAKNLEWRSVAKRTPVYGWNESDARRGRLE